MNVDKRFALTALSVVWMLSLYIWQMYTPPHRVMHFYFFTVLMHVTFVRKQRNPSINWQNARLVWINILRIFHSVQIAKKSSFITSCNSRYTIGRKLQVDLSRFARNGFEYWSEYIVFPRGTIQMNLSLLFVVVQVAICIQASILPMGPINSHTLPTDTITVNYGTDF